MRRLIVADSTNTLDWVSNINVNGVDVDRADNVLLDLTSTGINKLSQPISAPINASVGKQLYIDIDNNGLTDDFDRERWIFFGTGRFIVGGDALDDSQQSYYGIKEPYVATAPYGFTWEEVRVDNLLNSTNIEVYDDRRLVNYPGVATTWNGMIADMDKGVYDGWHVDFLEENERNFTQAALLGGILTFTTYLPSSETCLSEGTSNLYATWYQTGTAYYREILRASGSSWIDNPSTGIPGVKDPGETKMTSKTGIGVGISSSPTVFTNSGDGATAVIQKGNGDAISIDEDEGLRTKSGKTSWLQQR